MFLSDIYCTNPFGTPADFDTAWLSVNDARRITFKRKPIFGDCLREKNKLKKAKISKKFRRM